MLVDKGLQDLRRRSSSALGEKRAGQLQDLVGLAQFAHLALELLHTLSLAGRHPFSHVRIDLGALNVQRLRHAANVGRDGLDGAHSDGYSPRCSCTILTAGSRTSGENLFDLLMAQSAQSVEPSRN